MKPIITILTCIGLTLAVQSLFAQTQTEFPIGAFSFHNDTLNYTEMRDSLHLNWIVGYGGDTTEHRYVEHQSILKFITARNRLIVLGGSEHMEYEAEQSTDEGGLYNYFDSTETGNPDVNMWKCDRLIDVRGYMRYAPIPNNDFHYGQAQYYATFALKVTGQQSPTDTVATLSILCKEHGNTLADTILFRGNFSPSDSLKVELPFSLSAQPSPQPYSMFLTSDPKLRMNTIDCDSIDIRVYWHGHVTTWLDNVIVQDTIARELFAGRYQHWIDLEADPFVSGYANMRRLYMRDEPFIPAFLPYNYLDERLKAKFGTSSRGRATTALAYAHERFSNDAQPNELFIDSYPITASIPSPSIATSSEANDLGIAQYSTSYMYNYNLQRDVDDLMINTLKSTAEASKNSSPHQEWWFIPQLHGEYVVKTGQFRWPNDPHLGVIAGEPTRRPPTGNEIKMMINVALAFGAKGIIGYPFTTDSTNNWLGYKAFFGGLVKRTAVNGLYQDHSSDSASFPYGDPQTGYKQVRMNYKEKWEGYRTACNQLTQIADTLLDLTWKGTKSWWSYDGPLESGEWTGIVSALATKNTNGVADPRVFAEVGHLLRGTTTNYIYVVNRRCLERGDTIDIRDISMTLPTQPDNWLVTSIPDGRGWVVTGGSTFTDRFNPGEGKLYRLQSATLSGTRNFSQLKFVGGGVLTLASNANITARGNMDTVNIVLGSNAIFKADTGSAMVAAGANAFTFSAGSEVQLGGLLTAPNGVALDGNATLTVQAGATCRFGPDACLSVEGTLITSGTTEHPITLTAINQPWGGILDASVTTASTIALSHVNIESVNGTAVHVFNLCNFTMLDCTVDAASTGVEIVPGESVAQSNIQLTNVVFTNVNTGVYLNGSSNVNLDRLSIDTDGGDGVDCIASSPIMLRSSLANNKYGLLCLSGSSPMLEEYSSGGNNIFQDNSVGVECDDGSEPNLGFIADGNDVGGQNSFREQGNTAVVLDANSTVFAENNFWDDSCPPENVIIGSNCELISKPCLDEDPNLSNRALRGVLTGNQPQLDLNTSLVEPRSGIRPEQLPEVMRLAMKARKRGDYPQAIRLLKEIVSDTSLPQYARRWSLGQMLAVAQTMRARNIASYFSELPDDKPWLTRRAKELLPYLYLSEGLTTRAMEAFTANIQRYPSSDVAKAGMYGKFVHALFVSGDTLEARSLLNTLRTEYPLSHQARLAEKQMQNVVRRTGALMSGSSGKMSIGQTTFSKPTEFSVKQNFPNPFNPSTTINFDLPEPSLVSLVVYDVLGRKVVELESGMKEAGYHSATWNASDVSSGVYFARFTATDASGNVRLNKVNKLLLTK